MSANISKGKQKKNTKSDVFFALNSFYDRIPKLLSVSESERAKVILLNQLYDNIKLFLETGNYSKSEEANVIARYKNKGFSNSVISEQLGLKGNTTLRLRITRLSEKAYNAMFGSDDFPVELFDFNSLTTQTINGYLKRVSVATLQYSFVSELNPYINLLIKEKFKGLGKNAESIEFLTDTTLAEIVFTLAVFSNTTIKRSLDNFDPQDLKSVITALSDGKKNNASDLYNAYLSEKVDITPKLTMELVNYSKDFAKSVFYEPHKQVGFEQTSSSVEQSQTIIENLKTEIADLKAQLQSCTMERDSLSKTVERQKVLLEDKLKSKSSESDKNSDITNLQEVFGSDTTSALMEAIKTNPKLTNKDSTKEERYAEQDKVLFFLAEYTKEVFYEKLKLLDRRSLCRILSALNDSTNIETGNKFNIIKNKLLENKKTSMPKDIYNIIHEKEVSS